MAYREKRKDGTITVTGGVALLDAWPIGAVYTSIVNTNPGALFGGTWVAFATGRMLVGVDPSDATMDAAEETGGSKTKTININQMPSHTHGPGTYSAPSTGSAHSHGINRKSGVGSSSGVARGNGTDDTDGATQNDGAHSHTITGASDIAGGGAAFDVMNPYIAVYMFKRTA